MDKLPLELHILVLHSAAEDVFHPTTSRPEGLNTAFVVLRSLLNIALTSHYYHSVAMPVIRKVLNQLSQFVAQPPWRLPAFTQGQQSEINQLLAYIDDLSNIKKPSILSRIIKDTAPQTPYFLDISQQWNLSNKWIYHGAHNFKHSWMRGRGNARFHPLLRAQAGVLCILKSLNPHFIMLRYDSYNRMVEVRTSAITKKEAMEKARSAGGRKILVMGLEFSLEEQENLKKQGSHVVTRAGAKK